VRVAENSLPHEECPWHRTAPVDKRNGLLAGAKCPAAFVEHRPFQILPAEFASWEKENPSRAPPSRWSPLCPAEGTVPGAIVITWPRNDEVFLLEPGDDPETQSLSFAAEVEPRLPQLTWTLDGEPLASRSGPTTPTGRCGADAMSCARRRAALAAIRWSSRCARRGRRRRLGAYACGVAACGCEARSTEVERPEAR
jgi:hypothetical protein